VLTFLTLLPAAAAAAAAGVFLAVLLLRCDVDRSLELLDDDAAVVRRELEAKRDGTDWRPVFLVLDAAADLLAVLRARDDDWRLVLEDDFARLVDLAR